MVLRHELAHIKRRDNAWYLIATVAATIYWFNPLVWLARRKFMIEAEKACDDYVLCQGADACCYAEYLVETARRLKRRPIVAPLGVEIVGRTQLEERIMSLLTEKTRLTTTRRSQSGYLLVAVLFLVLPLAGLDLLAGDTPQKSAASATDSARRQPAQLSSSSAAAEQLPQPDDFVPCSEMPVLLELVEPVYPESAKKAGVEGKVWVKALVDTKGEVRDALIYRSSGHSQLDEAARQAAYKCKWKPAENDGKPVAVWLAYQVNFVLPEEKPKDRAAED
jgi:TonB family protein